MGYDIAYFEKRQNSIIKRIKNGYFDDITPDWIKFLIDLKFFEDPSVLIWLQGQRGSGKTGFQFNFSNDVMLNDEERFVQFPKIPKSFIEKIEKYCPEELKGRWKRIDRLREIDNYAILFYDEGLIAANSRKALTKEMEQFEGFLSSSRHHDVIFLINSVNRKIIPTIRGLADIKIYKHLSMTYLLEYQETDKLLQKFASTVSNLKINEALIFSGFKQFEKIGKVTFDIKDHCKWFNSDISKYLADANPDASFDEYLNDEKRFKKLAKEIIKKKGKSFRGKNGNRLFKAFFRHVYEDIAYDYKNRINEIYNFYIYYLDQGYYERYVRKTQSNELLRKIETEYKFNFTDEKVFEIIKSQKKWRYHDRDIEIYLKAKEGIFYRTISEDYPELNSDSAIHRIVSKVQGTYNYYKGKLFEIDFKKYLDTLKFKDVHAELDGTSGSSDVILHDEKNNSLYIFTLKCELVENGVRTFQPNEFKPELKQAYDCNTFQNYDNVYCVLAAFDTETSVLRLEILNYNNPIPVQVHF